MGRAVRCRGEGVGRLGMLVAVPADRRTGFNVACARGRLYRFLAPAAAPPFMQGLSPQQHCDGVAEQYKDLWKLLDIK